MTVTNTRNGLPMKNSIVFRVTLLAIALWIATPAVSAAPLVNPLLAFLTTSCSAEELGRVTQVKVLDANQANAFLKKLGAPQDAKKGDVYVQILAKSRASPGDYFMSKVQRAPSASETAELVGKAQCTTTGD